LKVTAWLNKLFVAVTRVVTILSKGIGAVLFGGVK
jgi:hypothetical protein